MNKQKFIDWLIFISCIIGLFVAVCNCAVAEFAEWALGCFGIIYCSYYLLISIFRPIKRDWILAKGRFLPKVINFVLLVPFVITVVFHAIDCWNCKIEQKEYDAFSPKDLVFEENLYAETDCKKDTLRGHITYGTIDSLRSEDSLISNQRVRDSIFIHIENKAPRYTSNPQTDPPLFWAVYYHFIDPGNQHMTTSETGRKRAALIAILGFLLLNGLLISTLINWFDRRRDQWINGEIRYNRIAFGFKNIAVVIGADETAPTIIKRLLGNQGEKPVDYVILLTNEKAEKIREQISSYLTYDEKKRVIIYNGQLDSIEEIYKLHINRATEIYVLGENSKDDVSHSYHDTQNMRCVHNIASYLTDKCVERKIICRVLFEYQTTFSVFQFSDLPDNIRQHLVFIPVNAYENWAQRVLVKGEYTETVKRILPALRKIDLMPTGINKIFHPVVNYLQSIMSKNNEEPRTVRYAPLDGTGICATSKDHVHFVVVGMSKMGVAMAIQAAQVAHYPNFSSGRRNDKGEILKEPSPIRTRITFIDENAENEMNFFMGRFQNLFALSRYRYVDASGKNYDANKPWEDAMTFADCKYTMQGDNFIDIEWEFVKGNVQSPAVMEYLKEAAAQADCLLERKSLLTIAICHPLAHEAIAAALYMPGEVYDNALQILVYQREASDIIYNLSQKEDVYKHKRYAKLRPFGMQYADFTMDKENFFKAQLCNYVYALIFDNGIDNKHIPDILCSIDLSKKKGHMKEAVAAWKKLSIFNKWSNRYLANSFGTKLRSIEGNFADITMHYGTICSLFEKNKIEMAECEHNRWNVQQLLMGFRACKDDELAEFKELKEKAQSNNKAQQAFKEFKARMKNSPERVHLNICSVSMLHKLDKNAEGYDEVFNASIPAILRCVENHNRTTNKTV